MSKNKLSVVTALFSTGLVGVFVGAYVVSQTTPNITNSSFALPSGSNTVKTVLTTNSGINKEKAQGLSNSFVSIAEEVTPAIVSIYSTKIVKRRRSYHDDDPFFRKFFGLPEGQQNQEQRQQGLGSGVIVDSNGFVLTNNHVIEGADDIRIVLSDKREFKAKIIGRDARTDVAVIKIIDAKDLPIAKLGNSGDLNVGEWVMAIGNPFGLSSTVTAGIISAKGRVDVGIADFEDFIQTDAAINPGNSGGALVNLKGEVIGINTAIASGTGGYMGIGFAIPSNMASKIMRQLIDTGKVSRGFIGIQIQDLTPDMAKALKVDKDSKGIIVGDIFTGSPAEEAGLQRYDVIVQMDGQAIENVNSFRNNVAAKAPGEKVKLTISREGKILKKLLVLGNLDDSSAAISQKDAVDKLGFKVEPITPEVRSNYGIASNVGGVLVYDLEPTSNAASAGVKRGDVIQEVNRQRIRNTKDFNRIIKEVNPGDAVLLKLIRNNQSLLLGFTYQ